MCPECTKKHKSAMAGGLDQMADPKHGESAADEANEQAPQKHPKKAQPQKALLSIHIMHGGKRPTTAGY